jgi:hypothetical protein
VRSYARKLFGSAADGAPDQLLLHSDKYFATLAGPRQTSPGPDLRGEILSRSREDPGSGKPLSGPPLDFEPSAQFRAILNLSAVGAPRSCVCHVPAE